MDFRVATLKAKSLQATVHCKMLVSLITFLPVCGDSVLNLLFYSTPTAALDLSLNKLEGSIDVLSGYVNLKSKFLKN